MSRIRKWTIIVSVLAIMVMMLPAAAGAAPLSQGESYTVQKDDSLWLIAEKYLGSGAAYMAIVQATNAKQVEDASFAMITDAALIQPGWKLWIPSKEEAEALHARMEKNYCKKHRFEISQIAGNYTITIIPRPPR